jgi:rhomboid protease GluP
MSIFKRRTTGSVVCPACGSLVGVRDDKCYSCGRANPGLWGFGPALRRLGTDFGFVPVVITGSTLLYFLALILSGGNVQTGGFAIIAPSGEALYVLGASGAVPVFGFNHWWTLLSATWLHAGVLHILFNMMWVRDLGPLSAEIVGPARTVIIYTMSGVTGFLLSSAAGQYMPRLPMPFGMFLHGSDLTVGASASVFGLLGALVHYGRKSGSRLIRGQMMGYAITLFVMGLVFPGVDNFAHAGGFVGGYATSMVFNPLTRERGDHTLIAVLCLAATLLAVVASFFTGLPRF